MQSSFSRADESSAAISWHFLGIFPPDFYRHERLAKAKANPVKRQQGGVTALAKGGGEVK